ncbi:YlbD family protein [Bacillus marasmi]|uniref:YlbD family protein n=1 Tax=Bacillus marasmi TaxID=1926279 RepID=UPI001FE54EE9|nr:YlbD family protein [Bacillus marasmi]
MGKLENNQLHPSVESFKNFVKGNPKLIDAVKKGTFSWQELYEDWYLLGEDDPRFAPYLAKHIQKSTDKDETPKPVAEDGSKKDWVGQFIETVKNMDAQQLSLHVNQLSQTLSAIQGVLSQFQGNQSPPPPQTKNQPSHPFQFRKD